MADEQEQTLQIQLDKVVKELKYDNSEIKITNIPSDGSNFTSRLFKVNITAPNKPDLNLFAKVAVAGKELRAQNFLPMFDVEKYTYSTLAKIYEEIQDKYEVPKEHRHRIPKLYACDSTYLKETVVIEDLTAQGFETIDRLACMDWEYASRSIEELAKWHALSVVFEEEYPEEFEKANEVLKVKIEDFENMNIILQLQCNRTLGLIADDGNREKLRKFLEKNGNTDYLMPFLLPMKRPILIHGDFKMNNVMHKYQKDKLDIVMVDYQAVHLASVLSDIIFFLIVGTDEEFRSKHFFPLLEHYYEHLCANLRRLNREPEVAFPREDFDYEIKKCLPLGFVLAIVVLPAFTATSENTPKVDKDLNIQSLAKIPASDVYNIRINGLLNDFVKWGII